MRLQHKSAFIIFVFGIVFVVAASAVYYFYSINLFSKTRKKDLRNIVIERSRNIDRFLQEKVKTAVTMTTAPVLIDTLLESNSWFELMTGDERKAEIARLNARWKETADLTDSFIQSYLSNPVSNFLRSQQKRLPEEYGEIFVTNRYGTIVASTSKLTTLAHAHKYWWKAGYDDGKGRPFFDDRGFDTSVGGIVLGVVVPVRQDNEIIGILKCNLNIMGSLDKFFDDFELGHSGEMFLARSGGLIIYSKDTKPLSTEANEAHTAQMLNRQAYSELVFRDGQWHLEVSAPISVTLGSERYGFGGTQDSIDHIKGNRGEAWYIILSEDLWEVLLPLRKTAQSIVIVSILLVLMIAGISIILGRRTALPIILLKHCAEKVGNGDLEAQVDIKTKDELGELAASFNSMIQNLAGRTRELQDAQERLVRQQKLAVLGQLAGGVSHELRNPLGVITNAVYYLQMALSGTDETTREYLGIISSEVGNADKIISDLLSLSQVKAGEREQTAVSDLVAQVLEKQAPPENVRATTEAPAELPPVCVNSRQIGQVLGNLVANAYHAMPEGGELVIKTAEVSKRLPKPQVAISISDTGYGIPKENLEKIFEPLYTTKARGIGLGLAVSKNLVEVNGGRIEVESEQGRGSTFRVFLPSERSPSEEQQ